MNSCVWRKSWRKLCSLINGLAARVPYHCCQSDSVLFSRMWISDIHIESKQDLDWRLAFNHPDTTLYHSSAVAAKSVADWMPSVNEHSPWKNIYHVYQSFSNWSKSSLPYCLLGLLTSWNNLVHGVLHTILIHIYIYIQFTYHPTIWYIYICTYYNIIIL